MSTTEKYFRDASDNDSLMTDTETLLSETTSLTRRSQISRYMAIIRENWWIIEGTGMSIIIVLLVGLYRKPTNELRVMDDVTGFAPKFTPEITMFKSQESIYMPEDPEDWFSNKKVKEAWLDLVPNGLGYVSIDEPELYSFLPTPLKDKKFENTTVYTTSMTHQLHCLHAAIHVYYSNIATPRREPPQEMLWHLRHCFDYMRQGIMCAGDIALEGAETTFPEGWDGSDGWDARHVCKNYNEVKDYLEMNRAEDKRWI